MNIEKFQYEIKTSLKKLKKIKDKHEYINSLLIIENEINNNLAIIEKKEIENFFLSKEDSDINFLQQMYSTTPSLLNRFWDVMENKFNKKELLFIFKNNPILNKIGKNNKYILDRILNHDISLLSHEVQSNVTLLDACLLEGMDISFIKEKKALINESSEKVKEKIVNVIVNSYNKSCRENQKMDILELLLGVKDCYKYKEHLLENIIFESKKLGADIYYKKACSLISESLSKNMFEYLNEKEINAIDISLLYNFVFTPNLFKKCMKNQPKSNINDQTLFPLIKNENLITESKFTKIFDLYKSYYGSEAIKGSMEEQKEFFNRILEKQKYYDMYRLNSHQKGTFLDMLKSIASEENTIFELKELTKILLFLNDENLIKNKTINDVCENIKHLDKDYVEKIFVGSRFKYRLKNMEGNPNAMDMVMPCYIAMKEKEELSQILNKEKISIKKRI